MLRILAHLLYFSIFPEASSFPIRFLFKEITVMSEKTKRNEKMKYNRYREKIQLNETLLAFDVTSNIFYTIISTFISFFSRYFFFRRLCVCVLACHVELYVSHVRRFGIMRVIFETRPKIFVNGACPMSAREFSQRYTRTTRKL